MKHFTEEPQVQITCTRNTEHGLHITAVSELPQNKRIRSTDREYTDEYLLLAGVGRTLDVLLCNCKLSVRVTSNI